MCLILKPHRHFQGAKVFVKLVIQVQLRGRRSAVSRGGVEKGEERCVVGMQKEEMEA